MHSDDTFGSKVVQIDSYSFGLMSIGGKRYTSDLIVYPDGRIHGGWWRRRGHRLGIEDLHETANTGADAVVVGTGYSGMMSVPAETETYLKTLYKSVIIRDTKHAVKAFNDLSNKSRVVGLFHLTC